MEKHFVELITIPIQEKQVSFLLKLKRVFCFHWWFLFILCLYAVSLVVVSFRFGVASKLSLSLYSGIFWKNFMICVIARITYIMIAVRPDSLFHYIAKGIADSAARERLWYALPIILFLPLFSSVFTSFKTLLPLIHHESWDTILASCDGFVHGGIQPWQLLHPFVAKPLITFIINIFYNLWVLILSAFVFWQMFSSHESILRLRFFLSFFLSWILMGTVLAGIFYSAGPCYYGRIAQGPDMYKPLMDYLANANNLFPIWALDVQDLLWKSYMTNQCHMGSGISAMPSMHVSMATLFYLVARKANRSFGRVMLVYGALIMVGSVHLGWHYAIDGYAGIVLMLIIWRVTGYIAPVMLRRQLSAAEQ